MSQSADRSVQDRLETRLKLREDLSFGFHQYRTQKYVHLEVQETGDFYRVGFAEYTFISYFDGETTLAQAITLASQQLGSEAFSQDHAFSIYDWLLEHNLAEKGGESDGASQGVSNNRASEWGLQQLLNPLSIKLPLIRGNQFFAPLLPFLGWLFSWRASLAGIAFILSAAAIVARDFDRFQADTSGILAPDNWLWLIVAWIGLKVIHELGHAICCLHYGGEIRQAGIVMVVLAPLAYVDVTSSWRFSSKWQRVHVALAGIYMELLIAAAAVFIYANCDSEALADVLRNVIVMATMTTLLFNANPLMKFDGYYVLTDIVEFPNLQAESQKRLNEFWRWLFLGLGQNDRRATGTRSRFAFGYGILSTAWRLSVSITLLIAAATLFHGVGMICAALAALGMVFRPVTRIAQSLVRIAIDSPIKLWRAATVATAIVAAFISLYTVVPSPWAETAPGVVDYSEESTLRAEVSGFVESIVVASGQHVEAGDELILLSNPELAHQVRELELQLEQTRLRYRLALQAGETALAQIESQNLASGEEQLKEHHELLQSLSIRAPKAGQVTGYRLNDMVGQFVRPGDELCRIADESQKELVVYVPHGRLEWIQDNLDRSLAFRVGTREKSRGVLTEVEPSASKNVEQAAVLASSGGPLEVREAASSDGQARLELLTPRFKATMSIPEAEGKHLFAGELGSVRLADPTATIGSEAFRGLTSWIRSRWEFASQATGGR